MTHKLILQSNFADCPPYWWNFIRDIETSGTVEYDNGGITPQCIAKFLKEYRARFIETTTSYESVVFLEFETAEDASVFILKNS